MKDTDRQTVDKNCGFKVAVFTNRN